jgi:ABC-type polysaccharide/polyol phosphate export permease
VQFVLTLGIAYLLAAVHVRFRDVRYLLGVALLLGFYLTPVFYSSDSIPPAYQALYHLNPLVTLLENYRALLLGDGAPHWGALLIVAVLGLAGLLLGMRLFKRMSLHFAEEL